MHSPLLAGFLHLHSHVSQVPRSFLFMKPFPWKILPAVIFSTRTSQELSIVSILQRKFLLDPLLLGTQLKSPRAQPSPACTVVPRKVRGLGYSFDGLGEGVISLGDATISGARGKAVLCSHGHCADLRQFMMRDQQPN